MLPPFRNEPNSQESTLQYTLTVPGPDQWLACRTSKHLSAVRSMADKCLMDYADHWVATVSVVVEGLYSCERMTAMSIYV